MKHAMILLIGAVCSLLPLKGENTQMTVDGYTFVISDVSGIKAASLIDVTKDGVAEAAGTGILDIPSSFTVEGETFQVVEIRAGVFSGKDLEQVEEVRLPSECTILSEDNFHELSDLRRVYTGDKLQTIRHNNFCNMPLLEEFALPESFEGFDHTFLSDVGLTEIRLPSKVSRIWGGPFSPSLCNLPNLVSLSLGGVTHISGYSLCDIPLLSTLTIPATCISIGAASLQNMESLVSVSFAQRGDDELDLSETTFAGCPLLKDFYVDNPVPFKVNCAGLNYLVVPLSECTLHVPAGTKDAYSAAPFWSGFGTITDNDGAGVETVAGEGAPTQGKWYSVDGREIDAATYRGIAIRRAGNTVTKHLLK